MDSKTEPASEAKERIERDARKFAKPECAPDEIYKFHDIHNGYIAGSTAEYNRAKEEITRLKAELERERELRRELVKALKDLIDYKWTNESIHRIFRPIIAKNDDLV